MTQILGGFSPAEILVLFEWIVRNDGDEKLSVVDHAEQLVLWKLEATLEKTVVGCFRPDYDKLLELARKEIRELA